MSRRRPTHHRDPLPPLLPPIGPDPTRASSSGEAQPCPAARVWVSMSPAWFWRCSGDSALSAATVADGRRMAGRKRAVLVGINYPGTKAELKGYHNDVARMRRCLVNRFDFDDHGAAIRVLSDADPAAPLQPTGANIRRELARLVADARPGDSLFFHYSGHGTRLPAETGQDDDTGYNECIVPSDMNLITGAEETVCVGKKPPNITSESVGIPSRDLLQLQKVPNGMRRC